MGHYTLKHGKWFDKKTGEEVTLPSKGDTFAPGSTALVAKDYEGYSCPVTGKWVEGRTAHRENLKRHGCRLLERGERERAEKTREREFREQCSRTAHEMVARMAPHIEV